MARRRKRDEDGEDEGAVFGSPVRTCLLTREQRDRERLIRFVLSPEGEVTPDIAARLPGRGVWLTTSRRVVAEAARRRLFERGFRAPAKASGDLSASVDALLERDALQMLSLANKAGLVVAGFAKVEAALGEGGVAALIHAADGGADGVRKLGQAARRALGEGADALETVNLFVAEQLGLALGRPHVIHAALKSGAAAKGFLARYRRLRAFRTDEAEGTAGPFRGFGADERTEQ